MLNFSKNIRVSSAVVLLCIVPLFGCRDASENEVRPENTAVSDEPHGAALPTVQNDRPSASDPGKSMAGMGAMAMPSADKIVFKDDVTSNTEVPAGLNDLVFVDKGGDRIQLESYLGHKNVVLVFTEGFAGGMLCPFCKTQTARLVGNYDKFVALDTEVLVVYPGDTKHLDEFVKAATQTEKRQVDRIPFPVVLDQEMKAVGFFNIASNLAHPSTFIIDKAGNVKLAYVGADMTADRPSVATMLKILENTRQEK